MVTAADWTMGSIQAVRAILLLIAPLLVDDAGAGRRAPFGSSPLGVALLCVLPALD